MSLGCTLEYRCINIRIKLSNSIFLSNEADFIFFLIHWMMRFYAFKPLDEYNVSVQVYTCLGKSYTEDIEMAIPNLQNLEMIIPVCSKKRLSIIHFHITCVDTLSPFSLHLFRLFLHWLPHGLHGRLERGI